MLEKEAQLEMPARTWDFIHYVDSMFFWLKFLLFILFIKGIPGQPGLPGEKGDHGETLHARKGEKGYRGDPGPPFKIPEEPAGNYYFLFKIDKFQKIFFNKCI